MIILRDEKRIARYKAISQYTSLIGFLALMGGLAVAFLNVSNVFFYQFLALTVGWLFSQIGLYLAHRYLRSPRPDEVLDQALKKTARDGRLYHYLLPAPHVLLTPAGPIILVAKYQSGHITAQGDKWKQTAGPDAGPVKRFFAAMRRVFSQEGLGNPSREAEAMVKALAGYLHKHAPQVEEVPIGALIVFTGKDSQFLDVNGSTIPAMHFSKLKGFLKQQGPGTPLPLETYEAIQSAFDKSIKF
ncbi:MAG: nuclease-related domain-containing protein [Chloroflexota bacterium]